MTHMCPYHGRINKKDIVEGNICGRCKDEGYLPSDKIPEIKQVENTDHVPRYRYDCKHCRFNRCCGPKCHCGLKLRNPPLPRAKEVAIAIKGWTMLKKLK